MRLLALLFAFYFACLSSMTCADEVAVCKDEAQTTVTAASHADCAANSLGDWCSPLCQCHCCGGAILLFAAPPALAHSPLPEWGDPQRHAELVVLAPTQASAAVWQPPRA